MFDKLQVQCDAAEGLYTAECSRLSTIQDRIEAALRSSETHGNPLDSSIYAARQQLAQAGLHYSRRIAQRLLLFARVNATASSRILDKVVRTGAPHNDGQQRALSQLQFYNPTASLCIVDRAQALLSETAIDPASNQNIWQAHADDILRPFLATQDDVKGRRVLASHEHLHWLIELCGLQLLSQAFGSRKTFADTGLSSSIVADLVERHISRTESLQIFT